MRNRLTLFSVVWLLLAAIAVAQKDRVDDLINAEMKQQNIPALSLAVVKDGHVVKAKGYGLADRERRIPATAETVYTIASVAKQFIATGIMLLVQDSRLSVDDPISRYLEGTPASWQPITIRNLLTHTSGIIREPPGFDPFKVQTDAVVIASAYSVPLRFPPGEKWEYSNTGYFALAEIIRRVSGQPWHEYLHDTVFRPSGMKTTFPTNTKEPVTNRAVGYTDNEKLMKVDPAPALRPSGAFLSTVLDMAKWDAMLYTDRILTEATRRQMWTAVTLKNGTSYPYGFGWQVEDRGGRRLAHHGGGGPGARAKFARFVDDRLTIMVLMNMDDVDVDSIVYGVANFYLPR